MTSFFDIRKNCSRFSVEAGWAVVVEKWVTILLSRFNHRCHGNESRVLSRAVMDLKI